MAKHGTVTKSRREEEGYFGTIRRAAWSIIEGMAVTFSYFRRLPITVQYPDRLPRPMDEMLPERFRGLLEVDVLCCTGCQACERACPIDVIRIRVGKEGKIRMIERFDIDLGKCMYCGFCVDSCPVVAQAPGDTEPCNSIRFTREFEGTTANLDDLVYRFIRPGDRVVVAKNKKGQIHPTAPRGERLREAQHYAAQTNAEVIAKARARLAADPLARVKPDLEEAFKIPVKKEERAGKVEKGAKEAKADKAKADKEKAEKK
jgi:formate hydrogenlyase subunit 6/NADH:ubiquinone oxidoreductase subunit I